MKLDSIDTLAKIFHEACDGWPLTLRYYFALKLPHIERVGPWIVQNKHKKLGLGKNQCM